MRQVRFQVRNCIMRFPSSFKCLGRALPWSGRDEHVADASPAFIPVENVDRRWQDIAVGVATKILEHMWVTYLKVFSVFPVEGSK